MKPSSSWKDANSHQMTMALLCCATWYAPRWGDTSMSTTVAETLAIIRRHSTSTREWSQIRISRKIGLPMAFIGAEWVSSSCDHSNRSSSFEDQVSKVMGLMALYYLYLTNYLCRSISSGRSSELCKMVRDPLVIPKVSHALSDMPEQRCDVSR